MKTCEKPEMQIRKFALSDILTTSSTTATESSAPSTIDEDEGDIV